MEGGRKETEVIRHVPLLFRRTICYKSFPKIERTGVCVVPETSVYGTVNVLPKKTQGPRRPGPRVPASTVSTEEVSSSSSSTSRRGPLGY